jgi:hypothetical protein
VQGYKWGAKWSRRMLPTNDNYMLSFNASCDQYFIGSFVIFSKWPTVSRYRGTIFKKKQNKAKERSQLPLQYQPTFLTLFHIKQQNVLL